MQRGFSLIEVMVALVMIALVSQVVLSVSTQQLKNLQRLERKTFAAYVAQNFITEYRLSPDASLQVGDIREVEMAHHAWKVEVHDIDSLIAAPFVEAVNIRVYFVGENVRDDVIMYETSFYQPADS